MYIFANILYNKKSITLLYTKSFAFSINMYVLYMSSEKKYAENLMQRGWKYNKNTPVRKGYFFRRLSTDFYVESHADQP
jgi:hypothetical protein